MTEISIARKISYLSMAYVCNKLSPLEEWVLKEWRSLSKENEDFFQYLIHPETNPELHEEVRAQKKEEELKDRERDFEKLKARLGDKWNGKPVRKTSGKKSAISIVKKR